MSGNRTARRVVLRRHAQGALQASDFAVDRYAVPEPDEGQFLVRILYASVDPMLRLFVDRTPLGGAMPPLPAGTTIPGAGVGVVVASHHPAFTVGEHVEGRFGWQHYAISDGTGVNRVGTALGNPENALAAGGLPGFTAYVGLNVAGGVAPGQTVLVSGAAGAVGSVVGPLVKARGGRAVGIAGGAVKARYLIEQVGYDAVADRLAPDFADQLKAALPDGATIYFDNVGGPLLAEVAPLMARGGLVLICGLMAQYQAIDDSAAIDHLPAVLRAVMFRGLRIQGFTQAGRDDLRPAFEAEIGAMLADGRLRTSIHIVEGIERLPEALVNLFDHSIPGKVVARIDDADATVKEV